MLLFNFKTDQFDANRNLHNKSYAWCVWMANTLSLENENMTHLLTNPPHFSSALKYSVFMPLWNVCAAVENACMQMIFEESYNTYVTPTTHHTVQTNIHSSSEILTMKYGEHVFLFNRVCFCRDYVCNLLLACPWCCEYGWVQRVINLTLRAILLLGKCALLTMYRCVEVARRLERQHFFFMQR